MQYDLIEALGIAFVVSILALNEILDVSLQIVYIALIGFSVQLSKGSLGEECHNSTCYGYDRRPCGVKNLKPSLRVFHAINTPLLSDSHVGPRLLREGFDDGKRNLLDRTSYGVAPNADL